MVLSAGCPVDQANPAHCPLYGLRPLGLRKRQAWLRGLSLEELQYLVSYHAVCAAEKLSGLTKSLREHPGLISPPTEKT